MFNHHGPNYPRTTDPKASSLRTPAFWHKAATWGSLSVRILFIDTPNGNYVLPELKWTPSPGQVSAQFELHPARTVRVCIGLR